MPADVHAGQRSGGSARNASLQPSPAVVASSSRTHTHVLPRRFLGPMPEVFANSEEVEERHRYFMKLRHNTMKRIRSASEPTITLADQQGGGSSGTGTGSRRGVMYVRQRRKVRGRMVEEQVEMRAPIEADDDWLGSEDDDEADNDDASGFSRGARRRFRLHVPKQLQTKKKKKRKDIWVGESFDVGQEFVVRRISIDQPPEVTDTPLVAEPDSHAGIATASSSTRPGPGSRATTQESFVTARTEFSAASKARSQTTLPHPEVANHQGSFTSSTVPSDTNQAFKRQDTSSTQPLIPLSVAEGPGSPENDAANLSMGPASSKKSHRFKSRFLKSALRKGSTASAKPDAEIGGDFQRIASAAPPIKAKTVQFPVDLDDRPKTSASNTPRTGDQSPADPSEVLNRQGDEAAGTSHEVTADAEAELQADEEEEPDLRPGQIIMRDRMLVRVGYHREEGFRKYDEHEFRKAPCSRLEAPEEYNVVYRKGQIEFYQDWTNPLRRRFEHHQRLCFVVPLLPARSSLCVFNEIDMTLCLTTSAGKLEHEVQRIMAGPTRTTTIKNRVKQSKQVKWLRQGRRGTHVFIMKVAERSRALDWYWEIWRELGGELPSRIDVQVTPVSTSVRLLVPDSQDMVGGKQVREQLNPGTVVDTCWEMLAEAVDVDELINQTSDKGASLELELAWRSEDGRLDWVAWDTTVQGRKRDWALLVGMAKMQSERTARILQLRTANHRVRALHLEDGSTLEEPQAIEGYLIRHKSAITAKENIYAATHDGHVFIASTSNAHPPLTPKPEASSPADLFPEVHDTFVETEHRRMALFMEHCAGGIDFRSIVDIRLCEPDTVDNITPRANGTVDADGAVKPTGSPLQRSFEVELDNGHVDKFEAHSPEIAREWVERLSELRKYWRQRQRIDARMRMDAIGQRTSDDPFALYSMTDDSDTILGDIWDWCTIRGCRSTTAAGRLYLRKSQWGKFRSRMIILTGGCLVTFKVKAKNPFQPRRGVYPLFGAYVYSGMLATYDMNEATNQDLFDARGRVYQDGLQSSDDPEDTTFCVRLAAKPSTWGKRRTQPWETEDRGAIAPLPLTTKAPAVLVFRARSKLERDRWVWAINAEMERQVRSHPQEEEVQRNYGVIPDR